MDISVIIVSWNVREKLKKNLGALFNSQGKTTYEVFVVDNNSGDGTAEMVRNEFPPARLIINQKNLGFAKANNQALAVASGRYCLLLNPDMEVKPDTLNQMIDWLDKNSRAGIAGCRLVDEKGEVVPHVRRFPKFMDQAIIALKISHIFPFLLNGYLCKNFDYSAPASVDSIRGSFFMIRRELMEKIGKLDERFFVWFEEVDYCRQARQAGYEIWYTPSAECVDLVGQSFKQLPRSQLQIYFRDSMLKYFEKWHKPFETRLLKAAWSIGFILARLPFKPKPVKKT